MGEQDVSGPRRETQVPHPGKAVGAAPVAVTPEGGDAGAASFVGAFHLRCSGAGEDDHGLHRDLKAGVEQELAHRGGAASGLASLAGQHGGGGRRCR